MPNNSFTEQCAANQPDERVHRLIYLSVIYAFNWLQCEGNPDVTSEQIQLLEESNRQWYDQIDKFEESKRIPIVNGFVDACYGIRSLERKDITTIATEFYSALIKKLTMMFPEKDVLTVRFKEKSLKFFSAPNHAAQSMASTTENHLSLNN